MNIGIAHSHPIQGFICFYLAGCGMEQLRTNSFFMKRLRWKSVADIIFIYQLKHNPAPRLNPRGYKHCGSARISFCIALCMQPAMMCLLGRPCAIRYAILETRAARSSWWRPVIFKKMKVQKLNLRENHKLITLHATCVCWTLHLHRLKGRSTEQMHSLAKLLPCKFTHLQILRPCKFTSMQSYSLTYLLPCTCTPLQFYSLANLLPCTCIPLHMYSLANVIPCKYYHLEVYFSQTYSLTNFLPCRFPPLQFPPLQIAFLPCKCPPLQMYSFANVSLENLPPCKCTPFQI